MLKIIVCAVVLTIAIIVAASAQTIRDDRGRVLLRAQPTTPGGPTLFYGRDGRLLGNAIQSNGQTLIYDRRGRLIGTGN